MNSPTVKARKPKAVRFRWKLSVSRAMSLFALGLAILKPGGKRAGAGAFGGEQEVGEAPVEAKQALGDADIDQARCRAGWTGSVRSGGRPSGTRVACGVRRHEHDARTRCRNFEYLRQRRGPAPPPRAGGSGVRSRGCADRCRASGPRRRARRASPARRSATKTAWSIGRPSRRLDPVEPVLTQQSRRRGHSWRAPRR